MHNELFFAIKKHVKLMQHLLVRPEPSAAASSYHPTFLILSVVISQRTLYDGYSFFEFMTICFNQLDDPPHAHFGAQESHPLPLGV